ncbi:hypothetical protein GCM10023187_42880 [Nibrella viscosa]|uniref:Outer membrane protein beta-barrel domain-containing protein n=1 Tax=Nibrella viscosa TaxID=1084524 RepID=A0ABP8KSP8_9BACT
MLRCQEIVRNQWKINWPNLVLGTQNQRAILDVAYEFKIGNSPLSINTALNTNLQRQSYTTPYGFTFLTLQPSLQLRYYLLQQYQIRRGTGGNNLSGFYVGPHTDYRRDYIHSRANPGETYRINTSNYLGVGGTVGFQQRLFNNAFIDIGVSHSRNVLPNRGGFYAPNQTTLKIGLGLAF